MESSQTAVEEASSALSADVGYSSPTWFSSGPRSRPVRSLANALFSADVYPVPQGGKTAAGDHRETTSAVRRG
jgi:hypothetical protein